MCRPFLPFLDTPGVYYAYSVLVDVRGNAGLGSAEFEVHHLLEKTFAGFLCLSRATIIAVFLTPKAHRNVGGGGVNIDARLTEQMGGRGAIHRMRKELGDSKGKALPFLKKLSPRRQGYARILEVLGDKRKAASLLEEFDDSEWKSAARALREWRDKAVEAATAIWEAHKTIYCALGHRDSADAICKKYFARLGIPWE